VRAANRAKRDGLVENKRAHINNTFSHPPLPFTAIRSTCLLDVISLRANAPQRERDPPALVADSKKAREVLLGPATLRP
jgi:hypothetical protein